MEVIPTKKKRPPYAKKGQTRGPKLEDILKDVANVFKQEIDLIKGDDRHYELVVCRRIYSYVCRKLTNAPLRQIGALINRDHSNVSFHSSNVKHWIKNNDPLFMDEWMDYIEASVLWDSKAN